MEMVFVSVQKYSLGPRIYSRLGYDFERREEIEIETQYRVIEIIDLGLVEY